MGQVEIENKPYLELPGPGKFLSNWSKDPSLSIHLLNEPDNLHPTNGNSATRSELFLYLHGALLKTDLRTGKILPGMCLSMPTLSKDLKSLSFELRPELRWDDGTEVTSDDVVFTIMAAKSPLTENPGMKSYFDFVVGVDKDPGNKRKFTIHMKSVYIQNIALWADYPIIQESFFDSMHVLRNFSFDDFNSSGFDTKKHKAGKLLETWSAKFNSPECGFDPGLISGLGPYKLVEWQQGQMIRLEKKKDHWSMSSDIYSEKSYPPSLIFRIDRDPVTLELALLKQNFDIAMSMPIRTLLKLKQDSIFNRNYHGNFVEVYGYTFVGLNMRPDENDRAYCLSERMVRKALAYLTPVDDINRIINKGATKRVVGPVARMKSSYHDKLALIPFDVDQANRYLDSAGWKERNADGVRTKIVNGKSHKLEIELLYMSVIPEWKEMGMMISEAMKRAGVNVVLNGVDPGEWMTKGTGHDFDMIMGSWNSTALPEDYAQLWSLENWKNNGLNFTGFGTVETENLIQKISTTMDDSIRDSLERQMQYLIADQQPYIFLYGLVRRTAVHRRFERSELYAERPGILYNLVQVSGAGVKSDVAP
jgi:peptide/nickel transport system substrate-binding protein